MKKILFFACLILIFSCRSKKIVNESTKERQNDSVSVISKEVDKLVKGVIIEKTRPVYSQTIIEKPCDSLGRIVPINIVVGSGGNKASVISKDGKLYIQQIIDSTVQIRSTEYREKLKLDSLRIVRDLMKEHSKTSEKVVYVYPWWIYAVIIGGILFLLLWVIEKFKLYRFFI